MLSRRLDVFRRHLSVNFWQIYPSFVYKGLKTRDSFCILCINWISAKRCVHNMHARWLVTPEPIELANYLATYSQTEFWEWSYTPKNFDQFPPIIRPSLSWLDTNSNDQSNYAIWNLLQLAAVLIYKWELSHQLSHQLSSNTKVSMKLNNAKCLPYILCAIGQTKHLVWLISRRGVSHLWSSDSTC